MVSTLGFCATNAVIFYFQEIAAFPVKEECWKFPERLFGAKKRGGICLNAIEIIKFLEAS